MKKLFLAIAAVAMVFATSCKKENANEPEGPAGDNEFICVIDQNANPQNAPAVSDDMGTLAHIDGNNNVWWQEGDVIMYHGNENTLGAGYYPLTCTKLPSDGRAYFSATGQHFYQGVHEAYYPSTLWTGTNLKLPSSITIDPDKNAAQLPMYGCGIGAHYLTFHNICAALKITIPSTITDCDRIVMHAEEDLCGSFNIIGDGTQSNPYKAVVDNNDAAGFNTITINGDFNGTDKNTVYVPIPAKSGNSTTPAYSNVYFELFVEDANETSGYRSFYQTPLQNLTRNIEVNKVYPVTINNYVCFTSNVDNNIISMENTWNEDPDPFLEYCKYTSSTGQSGNWTALQVNSTLVTLDEGDRLYLRAGDGTSTTRTNTSMNCRQFTSTGNVEVSGNIMYLLDGTNPPTGFGTTTHVFTRLFDSMTQLTSAKKLLLPATTLTEKCYLGMFEGCSALTTAPALEATILANGCYENMFFGCSALTTAPALEATTLADACYYDMFANCTSLTTAPALKARSLVDECYRSMFNGCSSLTSVIMLAEYDANTWPDALEMNLFLWLDNTGASGTIYVRGTDEQTSFGTAQYVNPNGWTVTVYQQQQPIRRK